MGSEPHFEVSLRRSHECGAAVLPREGRRIPSAREADRLEAALSGFSPTVIRGRIGGWKNYIRRS
jgi:hypothetical protein